VNVARLLSGLGSYSSPVTVPMLTRLPLFNILASIQGGQLRCCCDMWSFRRWTLCTIWDLDKDV